KLEAGWLAHDLAKLTEARTEADQAEGIALSGGGSPGGEPGGPAVRGGGPPRAGRGEKKRAPVGAGLGVCGPRGAAAYLRDQAGRLLAQPTLDEQYAAAFRQWGLDVDGTAEGEVVERLRQEPDVVVEELVAALDGWMIERRRQKRPEAEWRRLFRV